MKWGKVIGEVVRLAPSFISAVMRDPEEVREAMQEARKRSAERELERLRRLQDERED